MPKSIDDLRPAAAKQKRVTDFAGVVVVVVVVVVGGGGWW
jgi:hypothetical protein